MAATIAEGIDGLKALKGRHLGYSDWLEITQEQVDRFAEATGDDQWIHVDPLRAATGPFGGTIAHGFLTLSLAASLFPQILAIEGFSMGVNYGCDRVRFTAPVPVGCRLRAGATLDDVEEVPGGVQARVTLTYEVEGGSRPACVAVLVARHYL